MKKYKYWIVDILLLTMTLAFVIILDDFFYPVDQKEDSGKLKMSRWEQNMNGWMLQPSAIQCSFSKLTRMQQRLTIDQLIQKALLLKQIQRFESAFSACNQVIALDSTDARGYFMRGQILDLQSQNLLAMKDYSKTIVLKPKIYQAYLLRGALFLQSDHLFYGISDFLHALWLKPLHSLSFILVFSVNELF